MTFSIHKLIHVLVLNTRPLFLIDAVGALLSAATIGLILTYFQPFVGLPLSILYVLGSLAMFCAGISFFNASANHLTQLKRLKMTLAGNLSYAAITTAVLCIFREDLQPWGFTYFILELAVITGLIALEFRVLKYWGSR